LPLIVYSFLDDISEEPNFALSLSGETCSKNADISTTSDTVNKMVKREIRMQKRLDARTKGLLEVSKRGTGDTWCNSRVDFLHRTVGGFLNRKHIKARFIESAGPNFDPKISLCHGFLAVIKSIPSLARKENQTVARSNSFSSGTILEDLIHELLDYAYTSELETLVPQTEVIDELERFLCSTHPSATGIKLNLKRQSLKLDRRVLMNSESQSVLELCVQHGLSIYMQHRLELDPSLVSSRKWHRPLLSHAFLPVKMATRHRVIDPATMMRLLLEHGADPNAVDGDSTTWYMFVHDMIDRPSKSKLELMDLLLSKGADPSAGRMLLETLTILSTSPAKVYQMSMFDKLLESGANPNSKFDDSTVWKRYLGHLLHGKSGLLNRNSLQNEFRQVKQLLLSGADPHAISNDSDGMTVDEIIEATFSDYHTTELLALLNQIRLRTDGGFLSRVWKATWRGSVQRTSYEMDRRADLGTE
jgi:hypothetical protein